MNIDDLKSVANAIVAKQKGVLAADESSPTIKKRFDSIQLEATEENRRRYREILFTAGGIERTLGGVILFDETLRQSTRDGVPFPALLAGRGIIPGIKVDQGAKALALHPGNKVTEGLDGLRERLAQYRQLGAQFAKWRAVIEIDERDIPSPFGIRANAHALARYAALCQEAGLVPIVEPEVLMDGAHGIERCEAVTAQVLHAPGDSELVEHPVDDLHLPGFGRRRRRQRAVAARVVRARRHPVIRGDNGLAGCQSVDMATTSAAHLAANRRSLRSAMAPPTRLPTTGIFSSSASIVCRPRLVR